MHILNLNDDLVKYLLDFLTPFEFVHLGATCKQFQVIRNWEHSNLCGLKACQLLHHVFDCQRNVLIHGPGGCGKSYALNLLYNAANRLSKKIVMTGSTGVSSIALPEGITIHSFSGLRTQFNMSSQDFISKLENDPGFISRFARWKNVDILVVDEISMLGIRFLALLNMIAQAARQNRQPFGGIQIVFSGDFMQLPPVQDHSLFMHQELLEHLNLHTIAFNTSYRQKGDLKFFHLLQRMRFGVYTEFDVQMLKQRVNPDIRNVIDQNIGISIVPPFLFSKHVHVDELNESRMKTLIQRDPGHCTTSFANDTFVTKQRDRDGVYTITPYYGRIPQDNDVYKRANIKQPTTLILQHKAQYIMTFNADVKGGFVNGSVCMYDDDTKKLYFPDGKIARISKFLVVIEYAVPSFPRVWLRRQQYCLRVGYAVTIHASQGMTMSSAIVDLGKSIFACAQSYVACSRVRTFNDLYLMDFHPDSLKVNEHAKKYVMEIENYVPTTNTPTYKEKKQTRESLETRLKKMEKQLALMNKHEKQLKVEQISYIDEKQESVLQNVEMGDEYFIQMDFENIYSPEICKQIKTYMSKLSTFNELIAKNSSDKFKQNSKSSKDSKSSKNDSKSSQDNSENSTSSEQKNSAIIKQETKRRRIDPPLLNVIDLTDDTIDQDYKQVEDLLNDEEFLTSETSVVDHIVRFENPQKTFSKMSKLKGRKNTLEKLRTGIHRMIYQDLYIKEKYAQYFEEKRQLQEEQKQLQLQVKH